MTHGTERVGNLTAAQSAAAIDATSDRVVYTVDREGLVSSWSEGAEAVLGWSAEEAMGRIAAVLLADGGTDVIEGVGDASAAIDGTWRVLRHRRRDGSSVPLTTRSRLLPPDDDGRPGGIVVVGRDDAELRCAEQALRDVEAARRIDAERVNLALAAGAIIGTWIWDLPADSFTVDEPFARAFGLDPALGTHGLSLAQVVAAVHPDDRAALQAAIDAAIQRGGSYAHQYRTRRAHGRYEWLEVNGRVEHDGSGTPLRFLGVVIDVDDRRRLAEERDRALTELRRLAETLERRVLERSAELMGAEEALRQSQKMEAVGQLTGGLAHDFNNMLTAVTGGLELLSAKLAIGDHGGLDRYVAMARGGADRAAALTQRLLAFSRRQTLAPTPIDVDRLVAGMREIVDRTLGPEIEIEVFDTEGLWPVLADAPQLENALLNLCINARDAMPDGGRLTIETGNKRLDARAAAGQDLPEGEYVSLSVTDTGTGMPPAVVDRVFDPFYTTKPLGQGTGLGLSMIYGFVRQSGGQVRVYSEVDRGTTMCLYLPRHVGASASGSAPAVEEATTRATRGEAVLIVEDEGPIRQLVVEVLTEAGYRVLEAQTGPIGVAVLRSRERIDLLITDVGLPGGLNGRQVADAGREVRPELKVLFVTGYAANAAVGAGQLEAGMQVLTKPFNMAELLTRVGALTADRSST